MNGRWAGRDAADKYVADYEWKLAAARHRVRWLQSLQAPNREVLDIGAGNGAFCAAAAESRYECTGTELSQEAILAAKEHYGVDLVQGEVEILPPDPRFGMATMWDVIEHLRDPLRVLAHAHQRLLPDGILVVETGNYESAARLISGDAWGLYLYDHMYYFSPHSLEALLKRAGFQQCQLHVLPAEPGEEIREPVSPLGRLIRKAATVIRNPTAVADKIRQRRARKKAQDLWPAHWHMELLVMTARKRERVVKT
jgi:SAM-dependent methyltransferase